MTGMWRQLLTDHVPNSHGRCQACTQGGTGIPTARWPCGPRRTARIKLGEVEGAMEAVRPVIDLPADRQISWIRRRVSELADLLDGPRFTNSVIAAEAREELEATAPR
jgi:hypothetical protein